MKTVLHVEVGGSYGGSQRALQLYLKGCDRSLFRHDVLFFFPTAGGEDFLPAANRVAVLQPERNPCVQASAGEARNFPSWLRRAWRAVYPWLRFLQQIPLAIRIARFIRKGNYDLVHINNTLPYEPATLLAARIAGVQSLTHCRNPVHDSYFNRFAASLTGGVACVTPARAAEVGAFAKVPVRVCYDPVGRQQVDLDAAAALRQSLAPNGELLVGSTGRLSEQKGYEFFVQAAALVIRDFGAVRFAIAGEGEDRGKLERMIQRMDLEEHFCLLGFRQDAGTVLAGFDIFVSSSLWEGGRPLVVLEAMQLGKPIICTPAATPPEFSDGDQAVVVVPPCDPEALAKAILSLAKDPARRRQMGEAARQRSAIFDDQSSIREFDHFADDLIARAPSRT